MSLADKTQEAARLSRRAECHDKTRRYREHIQGLEEKLREKNSRLHKLLAWRDSLDRKQAFDAHTPKVQSLLVRVQSLSTLVSITNEKLRSLASWSESYLESSLEEESNEETDNADVERIG